jgi:hypothetical protein
MGSNRLNLNDRFFNYYAVETFEKMKEKNPSM